MIVVQQFMGKGVGNELSKTTTQQHLGFPISADKSNSTILHVERSNIQKVCVGFWKSEGCRPVWIFQAHGIMQRICCMCILLGLHMQMTVDIIKLLLAQWTLESCSILVNFDKNNSVSEKKCEFRVHARWHNLFPKRLDCLCKSF